MELILWYNIKYHLGEVSEWFKVQTWNVCVGETPPRVRIPPSPNLYKDGKT